MSPEVRKALSKEAFFNFFKLLERSGFEMLSREEILQSLKDKPAHESFRKKSEGMETGYVYRLNNKMIVIWSTYSEKLQGPKEHDQGWILIIDPRNRFLFYTHPMNRTVHFLDTLLERAVAYKELVEKWPVCPKHNEQLFLDLAFDENQAKTYFFRSHHVGEPEEIEIVDAPVSERSKKIIAFPFVRNKQYRKKNPDRRSQQAIRVMVRKGISVSKKNPVYSDLRHEKKPGQYVDQERDYSQYNEDHSE